MNQNFSGVLSLILFPRNCLFIYLFINFAKRPVSLTEQASLPGPEKKENL